MVSLGYPPFLRLPDCQYYLMVYRRLLLLRLLHCHYLSIQYHLDLDRNQKSELSMRCVVMAHMALDYGSYAGNVKVFMRCWGQN